MKTNKQPLAILFAGKPARAKLIDGTKLDVFVRELPDRYLTLLLECCENRALLIELCTYTAGDPQPEDPVVAFPQVAPPKGYKPVSAGWADNLSDDSVVSLATLVEKLNFSRAARKGEALIAAKKRIEPLYRATVNQVIPLIQGIVSETMDAASNLTPNTPSSPAKGGRRR